MKFEKFNANPKNKKTGDCVVRALAVALNKTWIDTYKELFENTLKTFYSVSSKNNYKNYLQKLNIEMQKMPKKENGKRYTIAEFVDNRADKNATYIISVANHLTVVKQGVLIDTWDCSKKSIGNYWKIN